MDLRKLVENQLGDSVFATPTLCGGQIFMRLPCGRERREKSGCTVFLSNESDSPSDGLGSSKVEFEDSTGIILRKLIDPVFHSI